MNVLFVGDVVSPRGVAYLTARLPSLRAELAVDLTVVNGENSGPLGMGMTTSGVDALLAAGADVVTGGNHSWQGPEAGQVLAHDAVLRPHNVDGTAPGKGLARIMVGAQSVTVLNLIDADALEHTSGAPGLSLSTYECWSTVDKDSPVIVDFHGSHVLEKQTFAIAVDGEAAAVLGTHTHEPSLPLHLLPGGTAFVAEVGMTGPAGGVMGFDASGFVAGLKAGDPYRLPPEIPPAPGNIVLGAILLKIESRRTVAISRIT